MRTPEDIALSRTAGMSDYDASLFMTAYHGTLKSARRGRDLEAAWDKAVRARVSTAALAGMVEALAALRGGHG
jgi:hypothetical protein